MCGIGLDVQLRRLVAPAALLAVLIIPGAASSSSMIVVTNTNDSGPGSLRQAIDEANADPNPNTVVFQIPASDLGFNGQWFTIRPLSELPAVTDDGTAIDGSGQTAFTGDTNPLGPEIELNGSLAPGARGLAIWVASDGRIDSIAVNSFAGGAVALNGARNVVTRSYVGTDAAGAIAGNVGAGVWLCCSETTRENRIVGNLIRGNRPGMIMNGDVEENVVQGNRIELSGPQPAPPGCGQGAGIFVRGNGNLIGGSEPGQGNVISGNGNAGIALEGGDGTIIQGNLIGTDPSGSLASGNRCFGIALEGSLNSNTLIGGTTLGARNVISGNGQGGIALAGGNAAGTRIEGNYIGTDAAGLAAIQNGGDPAFGYGILVTGGSATTIGGTSPGAGNVISGNARRGVVVQASGPGGVTGVAVEGNRIGTNAAGTAPVPNGSPAQAGNAGILFSGVSNSAIRGNLISGNGGNGIQVFAGSGSSGNTIAGNSIGTDAAGTAALPNAGAGVSFFAGGPAPGLLTGNLIGGATAADRNVIAANTGQGIIFAGGPKVVGNTIRGNFIGIGADGTTALGNGYAGIGFFAPTVDGPRENLVELNSIAYNQTGVLVAAGARDAISRNSIFANGGLGIDLGDDGTTPNDAGDGDTGPNELQNHPLITKADAKKDRLQVHGEIDTPNPETIVIEFFANTTGDPSGHGEGAVFLGTATPKPNGKFKTDLGPVAPGTVITATATGAAGNTSEFAANLIAR